MVVTCPKCALKLKVDESKLSPAGTRFKCPKCSAILLVKKPSVPAPAPAQVKTKLDPRVVLVAHAKPEILNAVSSILKSAGYSIITSTDGIDAMVKALKELPFLAIIEVSLPKIFGFEVCKRLKSREETKNMKFILVPAIFDKNKYRRDPVSLYGADEYIEEQDLQATLIDKINSLRGAPEEKEVEKPAQPQPTRETAPPVQDTQPSAEPKPEPAVQRVISPVETKTSDEQVEKAKRLARTVLNDIYLYNSAKVDDAIRNKSFLAVFESELREGRKLYDMRIPQEVRKRLDYFQEAVDNFIAAKTKALGL